MSNQFVFIVISISLLSQLVPIIWGYHNRESLLWKYALVGLIANIITLYLRHGLKINHQPYANLFFLIEFLFITAYYRKTVLRNSPLYYTFTIGPSAIFILGTVKNGVGVINTFGASIFSLCYMLLGIGGLFILLKEQEGIFLGRSSAFWINAAMVMYGSGSFLLFLFSEYLSQHDQDLYKMLWLSLFLILSIVTNMLLGKGLSIKTNAVRNTP